VFASTTTVLFYVGYRTKEIIDHLLGEIVGDWLISDGYVAYRGMTKRLCCVAHLWRKTKGLEESLNREGAGLENKTPPFSKC
jgi:transposase